jgi:uncharacterized protein with FMN-binding domain
MMHRSIPLIITTAAAVLPLTAASAATHPAPRPTATPAHATSHPAAHKTSTSTTYTYAGPGVDMQWGTVQVTIAVKGKRITDVRATAPTERERSAFINQQAVPMLRQEVLQAQRATVDLIGGATMTSEAYDQSLQAAVDKAHKAHTL